MNGNRTSIGLDVHARSVVGCALDGETGELLRRSYIARPVTGSRPMRDALHLAKLLHLGEIVKVTVPSVVQEAARDLVRAREDARGDLMSARHRVSKLLLRQGIRERAPKISQAHDVRKPLGPPCS